MSLSDKSLPAAEQDIAWMRRVAQGDTTAFEQLIEAHQTRVVGTVAKMLGDDRDAEDLAQQVFVRIWNSAPRYRPTAKFTTWLFTIMRNLVFNELRRRKRHDAVRSTDEESAREIATDAPSPDGAFLTVELERAIQAALSALPEAQRMAIVLRRYEECSYEEIAEILGLSLAAVKSLLFRARADLREQLRKYLDE
ncbi:MAG: sigma-70 family RNA polymerase sigma factor [Verrucomicrobiota bacterium]|nr:sigma-70 family RNA polymerase sigma factor [Verrucomicrobiota bacterium]